MKCLKSASFSCEAIDRPYPNGILLYTQMSDIRRRRLPIQLGTRHP